MTHANNGNRPGFLTRAEVERQLHVGRTTLQKLIATGELVAYRFGRDLRFDPADITAYITKSRIPTHRPNS